MSLSLGKANPRIGPMIAEEFCSLRRSPFDQACPVPDGKIRDGVVAEFGSGVPK
jgi:hypothetical protein